jgi:transposase-like protein
MKKQRKHYAPEEKVAILRRHLVEGVPISDLCDELGLQPTVFYRWQSAFSLTCPILPPGLLPPRRLPKRAASLTSKSSRRAGRE